MSKKDKIYDDIRIGFIESSPNIMIAGVYEHFTKSLNRVAILSMRLESDGTNDSRLALDIKPLGFPLLTNFIKSIDVNKIILITDSDLKDSEESREIHKILKDNYYFKLTGNKI